MVVVNLISNVIGAFSSIFPEYGMLLRCKCGQRQRSKSLKPYCRLWKRNETEQNEAKPNELICIGKKKVFA